MFGWITKFFRKKEIPQKELEKPRIPYKIRESDLIEQLEKKAEENVKLASENIRMKKVLNNIRMKQIAKEQKQDIVRAANEMAEAQKKMERKRITPMKMLEGKLLADLTGRLLGHAFFAKKGESIVLLVSDSKKGGWRKGMIPLLEGRSMSDILWHSSYINPKTYVLFAKYIHGVGHCPIPDDILMRRVTATVQSEKNIVDIVNRYGSVTRTRKEKKTKGKEKEHFFITADFWKGDYLEFKERMAATNSGKISSAREISLPINFVEAMADKERECREIAEENMKMGMAWNDVTMENERIRSDRAILKSGIDGIKADHYDTQKILEDLLPESMKLRKENLDLATSADMHERLSTARKETIKGMQDTIDDLIKQVGPDQVEITMELIARFAKFIMENKPGLDEIIKLVGGKGVSRFEKLLQSQEAIKKIKELGK